MSGIISVRKSRPSKEEKYICEGSGIRRRNGEREREREKEKTGGPRRLDRGPDGITQFEHKFEGL